MPPAVPLLIMPKRRRGRLHTPTGRLQDAYRCPTTLVHTSHSPPYAVAACLTGTPESLVLQEAPVLLSQTTLTCPHRRCRTGHRSYPQRLAEVQWTVSMLHLWPFWCQSDPQRVLCSKLNQKRNAECRVMFWLAPLAQYSRICPDLFPTNVQAAP